MEGLFLFTEPNKDCVTPKASFYTHTPNLSVFLLPSSSLLLAVTRLLFLQNHYYCSF